MKKITAVSKALALTALIFAGTSCSLAGGYDGKAYTDKAAALHTSLESAHITVTDNSDGTAVQEITYRFAGDVMQYMYIGQEAGKVYYEYNNGTELDSFTVPGDTKWSFAAKGDDAYYSYSRASRHYFADGKALFADYEAAVSSSEITDTNDGTRLELEYDDEKLPLYDSLTGVSGLHEYFIFDASGLCTEFGTAYTLGGERFDYTTRIEKRDEKEPITRTEPGRRPFQKNETKN